MGRQNVTLPSGGGVQCPPNVSLVREEVCNTQECPTSFAYVVWTSPATVRQGDVFQVIIDGMGLDPREDEIMLIDASSHCDAIKHHYSKARCDVGAEQYST